MALSLLSTSMPLTASSNKNSRKKEPSAERTNCSASRVAFSSADGPFCAFEIPKPVAGSRLVSSDHLETSHSPPESFESLQQIDNPVRIDLILPVHHVTKRLAQAANRLSRNLLTMYG